MPNWKLVITSGSDASLNSLNVTTSVTASSYTGSFFGDGTGLTGITATLSLSSSQIYVGNASNIATGVTMSGDVAITNTGVTTVQSGSITYPKLQNTTQASVLGNATVAGQVEEIPLIDTFLSTSSLPADLLDSGSNWDINGSYIGTAISGTFQGQSHYNDNYFYTAIQDNFWIRLIRG
jgi:hypothetical protein